MKFFSFKKNLSNLTLSIQGKANYFIASFVAVALLAFSLGAYFIPAAKAAPEISMGGINFDGSIRGYCTAPQPIQVSVYATDWDEQHQPGAVLEARYRIDEGGWENITRDDWDPENAQASFSFDFDCTPYFEDGLYHTFELEVNNPYSVTTTYGPTQFRAWDIDVYEASVDSGTVTLTSTTSAELQGSKILWPDETQNLDINYFYGRMLPGYNQFKTSSGTPAPGALQYSMNGGSFTDLSSDAYFSGPNFSNIYAEFSLPGNTLAPGEHTITFRFTKSDDTTIDLDFPALVGEEYQPAPTTITVDQNVGGTITLNGANKDLTGTILSPDIPLSSGFISIDSTHYYDLVGIENQNTYNFNIEDLAATYELSEGDYNMVISVQTTHWTYAEEYYTLTIEGGLTPPEDPGIKIDQDIHGNDELYTGTTPIISGRAVGTASIVSSITYSLDGGSHVPVTLEDGNYNSIVEQFSIPLSSHTPEGEHTLEIRMQEQNGTTATRNFTLFLDYSTPNCGTTWYNQQSPAYTRTFNYSGITCTDAEQVESVTWRIYHALDGVIATGDVTDVTAGAFGSSSVSFDFTAEIPAGPPNYDGYISVDIFVKDRAGNEQIYYDPIVVDYEDQTPPTLSIQLVKPDPLHDITPTISGTCSDRAYRETNTPIQSIELQLNGGSWDSVTPLDGAFDSTVEKFAYTLPNLSPGDYEVAVRCTDGAGNTTTTSGSDNITFSVQTLDPDAEPVLVDNFTEDFYSRDFQDVADTTLIWGNGKLRLKEDITITRDPIVTSGYRDRYETISDTRNYGIFPSLDSGFAWYANRNGLFRLDMSSGTSTPVSFSGVSGLGGAATHMQEVEYDGKRWLFVSNSLGLSVVNITDGVGYQSSSLGEINHFAVDVQRGRMGVYALVENYTAPESRLKYWALRPDLGDVFDSSEIRDFNQNYAGMTGHDIIRVFASPDGQRFYVSIYESGLYLFDDNNTPLTLGDDQAGRITDASRPSHDLSVIFAVTFDPAGNLIFGSSGPKTGELFVQLDDNGTPFNSADDNIVRIATDQDLGYRNIYKLMYIPGLNDIGDQIFVQSEDDNPVYINFNNTYEDPYDDTFIELPIDGNIRPSAIKIELADYNTLYANIDRQGLFRINLQRGWEASGHAVALPPRPAEAVVINNFVAEASTTDPIAFLPADGSAQYMRQFIAPVHAQGSHNIVYEISLDDGATWEVVSLGELQQIAEEDYRLQFRISMTPEGSASPVVTTYSLQYGGYPDPNQINSVTDFAVTANPASVRVGQNFTFGMEAVDVLDLRVLNYNGNVSLQLLDSDSVDQTSALSVNSLSLVNGHVQVGNLFITRPGTYRIVASNGDGSVQSNSFVITPEDVTPPTPTPNPGGSGSSGSGSSSSSTHDDSQDPKLSFSSSAYRVCANTPFTLRWSSNQMTSATLNGEGIGTEGSREKTIQSTTTFELKTNGPKGSLTSTLTVVVDPNAGDCSQPQSLRIFTPVLAVDEDGNIVEVYNTPGLPQQDGSEGSGTEQDGESGSNGKNPKLSVGGPQVVIEGEKVKIWWEADPGTGVTVSTLGGESSSIGSFEFIARESQTVVITAHKDGQTTTQTVEIVVKKLPAGLGNIIPASMLPILAAGMRYAAISWLLLLGIIKLFAFFKRKPDEDEVEISWPSWIVKQFQIFLWVVSPLILLLSLLAASVLGGAWMIGIAVLCVLITLRHLVQWVRSE